MTAPGPDGFLLDLFQRARRGGMHLGIAELLAAREALAGGFGAASEEDLRTVLHLLWCSSRVQRIELDGYIDSAFAADAAKPPEPSPREEPTTPPESPRPAREASPEHHPSPVEAPPSRRSPGVTPLPVRAPSAPGITERGGALSPYYPVSRRAMVYTWRYLRRPIKDGPRDQIDLAATIERTARQGFFDQPVCERRAVNHAHLILLIDQGGSMVPFHRFTRDLVETATAAGGPGRVDLGYFQNVPPERIYLDPQRTQPIPITRLFADCSSQTSVLLVSDAGAARGARNLERVQATARTLVSIKRLTSLVAWLNPMPEGRWRGSSAQLIRALVDMFPMDPDGFSNAVDVLRGQPLGR